MRWNDEVPGERRPFRREGDDVFLIVRLTPRGGRDGVDGLDCLADGMVVLKARVRAIPENGQANAALLALIAKALACPRRQVSLASGETSRIKHLRIANCDASTLARLQALCTSRD